MLDQLTRDAAKVVAFDTNFPKPDEKSGVPAICQGRRLRDEDQVGASGGCFLLRLNALLKAVLARLA